MGYEQIESFEHIFYGLELQW